MNGVACEMPMSISLRAYKVHPTGRFDNHAREYQRIEVRPLASALGAEILGVDLRRIDDALFDEIADALCYHKMVYLRRQDLSLDDHEAFTLRFGDFGTDAYTDGAEGHPNVQWVVKEADDVVPVVFGGSWHTDWPFLQRPPAISMLYGVDIPPYGGDTLWANTQLAYDFLSDTMKAMLAPLRVHMSARNVIGLLEAHADESGTLKSGSIPLKRHQQAIIDGSFHPLVRTHPVTGRKALYVDESYALGIRGMTEAEATALIGFLCSHITQPAFTCRLRWEKGTFVMWDNRSCLHHAFNDHDGYRREMYRTIVEGEVPN
jgi:taurine dioxygenase